MKAIRHLIGLAVLLSGLGAGIYLWNLLEQGGEAGALRFTLHFEDAEGLRSGSPIRYRGVAVGEVKRIELDSGGRFALVDCVVRAPYRPSVASTTRFWVVRPRFRGLAEGATGLETLIKDSYVTYTTPEGHRVPLPERSIIEGLSSAPGNQQDRGGVPASAPGDLSFTVLFPDSGGLKRGSPVRHRGIDVGVVTEVDLDPTGTSVAVDARIRREHRGGVTDATIFWVARPSVSAGWIRGLDVTDIETILGGVHLAYLTPRASTRGGPARDGGRFVGATEKPDLGWLPPPKPSSLTSDSDAPPDVLGGAFVTVHYSCLEKDWLSRDDRIFMVSPGLLFRTSDGSAAVLVARSGVDGSLTVDDGMGVPEIANELWRVTLGDGSVFGAKRSWESDASDLALLVVEGDAPVPDPAPLEFVDPASAPLEIIGYDDRRRHLRGTLGDDGLVTGADENAERGIAIQDGVAVGVVSSAQNGGGLRIVPFTLLPTSFRPAE